MRLVLLGAPGAGKGTQAEWMAKELKIVHISSGDLFREVVRKGEELGKLVKSYMDRGALVPDDITVRMVMERSDAPDAKGGFLLDGFPRTNEQAKALDAALAKRKAAIDAVVYIKVAPEELQARLGGRWMCKCGGVYHEVTAPPKVKGKCDKCGGPLYQRDDDKAETVKKRIDVYFKETAPLIDYYKKNKKLVEVNGQQAIDDVKKEISAALKNRKLG